MRNSEILRSTAETDIELKLNLDGKGESDVKTSCAFLDHMLTLFAKHSRCSLYIRCKGDIEVDYHHTVEDVGICLGEAIKEALGDTDEELVEALMFDIRYQYALHTTSFEEQPLSDRSLSRFRARVLAYETEHDVD